MSKQNKSTNNSMMKTTQISVVDKFYKDVKGLVVVLVGQADKLEVLLVHV